MNHRLLSLTLAACCMCAVGCSAREKSKNLTVVCLERSSAFGFPTGHGTMGGRLLREIARQSFLVAARDQLGLQTRDASLGDEMPVLSLHDGMPSDPDNPSFDLLTVPAGRTCLEVRQGIESPTTLLHQPLHTTPVPPENFSKDRFGMPMDYRAWLTELEQLSRGGFVDAIKRAGFQGKPNSLKDAAEVPRQIEAVLEKMDFVSQFSAVRELHELIRVGGQSPERLGALARGYANLGLLTEFHWHPAHKAFTARSLVYAQRMVSSDKQAWRALWHW